MISNNALAEDPSNAAPAGTSTTSASRNSKSPFELTYWGDYSGPALSAPLKAGSINSTTLNYDDGSPQNLANQLKATYSLSPDIFVGLVGNFLASPFQGAAFVPYDSGVRIGDRHILHTDNFNFAEDLRVMAPIRPSYVAAGERINFRRSSLRTGRSPRRFSIGYIGFYTYQAYGANPRDPTKARKDFNLYVAPTFTYQVTRSPWQVVLYYEFYPWHKLGADGGSWNADPPISHLESAGISPTP